MWLLTRSQPASQQTTLSTRESSADGSADVLDVEEERGVGRDDAGGGLPASAPRPLLAVGQRRRQLQRPLAPVCWVSAGTCEHRRDPLAAYYALIPSFDHLSDADAEDERPPALVAAVEHRAVLQPPRVVRLDELALLGGGAGADDAVAEGEPGRRHLERALPAVRGLRRRGEEGEGAGEHGAGQHRGHSLAPADQDEAGAGAGALGDIRARRRGRGAGVPRGAGLREAEEEAGQRRRGGGRSTHGCLRVAGTVPLLPFSSG